jgi:p-methyltransferase
MRESGCDGLYLGLESANDRVLQNMDKRARVLDYKQGIEVLKKYDIPLFAAFIIGFPGETEDTINDNVSFIEESSPDFYSLKEFYYIHTTPIHSRHAEFQLEGENNIWKHNTMNIIQASEMKLKIFESVRNSIHLDPDLGLWYLIYLRDKGFDWKRIRNCQNIINEMVRQDNSGKYNNKEQLFAKFTKNMQGL